MNLIVGATGLLGMEICRQLVGAKQPVRALVRRTADPGKRAELEQLGVELVEGDLKDPASLRIACRDTRAVISTASSTFSRQPGDSIVSVDEIGQVSLVDAAAAAGVGSFVFISFRDNPRFPSPLSAAKRAVEDRLVESGLPYTVLQASYFMEVWLTPMLGFDPLHGKVRIYGDGTSKLSWISFRDVARIAVAALAEPACRKTILNVGGPEALSPREVVRMFETAGVAEITPEYLSEAVLREQYLAATDPLQRSFFALMLGYAYGDAIDIAPTMALLPVRLTSMREYISTVLAQLTAAH